MEIYKITPEGIRAQRLRSALSGTGLSLLSIVVYILVVNLNNAGKFSFTGPHLPILIFLVTFWLLRFFTRYRAVTNSIITYTLEIEDNTITRTTSITAPISIHFLEISNVIKRNNGDLWVYGNTKHDLITIPSGLERFGEVENLLLEIMPENTRTPLSWSRWLPTVVRVFLWLSVVSILMSYNKYLISASVGVLLLCMGYWSYNIYFNPNLKASQKIYVFVFGLIACYFLYTAYLKLTLPY